MLLEPNKQASDQPSEFGWYYVEYSDRFPFSGLMRKDMAKELARLWEGKVCRHSKAPTWWQVWRMLNVPKNVK